MISSQKGKLIDALTGCKGDAHVQGQLLRMATLRARRFSVEWHDECHDDI